MPGAPFVASFAPFVAMPFVSSSKNALSSKARSPVRSVLASGVMEPGVPKVKIAELGGLEKAVQLLGSSRNSSFAQKITKLAAHWEISQDMSRRSPSLRRVTRKAS